MGRMSDRAWLATAAIVLVTFSALAGEEAEFHGPLDEAAALLELRGNCRLVIPPELAQVLVVVSTADPDEGLRQIERQTHCVFLPLSSDQRVGLLSAGPQVQVGASGAQVRTLVEIVLQSAGLGTAISSDLYSGHVIPLPNSERHWASFIREVCSGAKVYAYRRGDVILVSRSPLAVDDYTVLIGPFDGSRSAPRVSELAIKEGGIADLASAIAAVSTLTVSVPHELSDERRQLLLPKDSWGVGAAMTHLSWDSGLGVYPITPGEIVLAKQEPTVELLDFDRTPLRLLAQALAKIENARWELQVSPSDRSLPVSGRLRWVDASEAVWITAALNGLTVTRKGAALCLSDDHVPSSHQPPPDDPVEAEPTPEQCEELLGCIQEGDMARALDLLASPARRGLLDGLRGRPLTNATRALLVDLEHASSARSLLGAAMTHLHMGNPARAIDDLARCIPEFDQLSDESFRTGLAPTLDRARKLQTHARRLVEIERKVGAVSLILVSGADRVAVVGERLVTPGDEIGGGQVVEISDDGVTVLLEGQHHTLGLRRVTKGH